MPFGRPWETDLPAGTRFPAKSVTISGDGRSCETCEEHQGTYDIPEGGTVEDALAGVGQPPYHPNCNCTYEVNYDAPDGYMTGDELEATLRAFGSIYQHYKDHTRIGPIDNILITLGIEHDFGAGDEVVESVIPGIGKSCETRAEELITLFRNYLRAEGIKGCEIEMGQWHSLHAWVVFKYNFINEWGMLETGVERYDPWLLPTWQQIKDLIDTFVPDE